MNNEVFTNNWVHCVAFFATARCNGRKPLRSLDSSFVKHSFDSTRTCKACGSSISAARCKEVAPWSSYGIFEFLLFQKWFLTLAVSTQDGWSVRIFKHSSPLAYPSGNNMSARHISRGGVPWHLESIWFLKET